MSIKESVISGEYLSLFRGYESVHEWTDNGAGMVGIIAIHNTNLGPALGGCRRANYRSRWEALFDVARLSRGMTYKAAMTNYYDGGLPLGGGKSILIPTKHSNRLRVAQYRSMGRFVESLGGRYIIAEDVGTAVSDVEVMRKETASTIGAMKYHPYGGDPSPLTALGTIAGMRGAIRAATGSNRLDGRLVYIEGIGKVGFALMKLLYESGSKLFVSNRSATKSEVDALSRAADEFNAVIVPISSEGRAIQFPEVEIYAPCALGGSVNATTIEQMPNSVRVIAGSANNVLLNPEADGDRLLQRNIMYAPDYVINNRGLWDVYCQQLDERGVKPYDAGEVACRCGDNEALIYEIMHRAWHGIQPVSPHVIADKMAEEVFLKRKQ